MDEKLSGYINSLAEEPPVINEKTIVNELTQRRKRLSVIFLSLAGLLWTLILYGFSFAVSKENQAMGILLLCAISTGYICAGLFAGIVLKFRKVVL